MELKDQMSTDSGSLGANSESDSPMSSGLGYGVPQVTTMPVDLSSIRNSGMIITPAVTGLVTADGAGVVGVSGSGSGSGELNVGKKKRGRPRKYDAEGNLRPGYIPSPRVVKLPGFTLSTPPSYEHSSNTKKGRVKLAGSGNFQVLASLGELFTSSAGGDFTAHVVTVHKGEDAAGKILTFAQKGSRGICVLSANGCVSNVTLRQPGSSGGLLTYEGRFEILTLTGSYSVSDSDGIKSRTGGLSVSLASPDGRVIGGSLAGLLMAASSIQIVVGTFLSNGYNNVKQQKKRQSTEPRFASPLSQCSPAMATSAIPISQAVVPCITGHHTSYQMPTTQVILHNHGEPNNNRDNPNSASTDTSDWNGSGGPSSEHPDINISVSLDDH